MVQRLPWILTVTITPSCFFYVLDSYLHQFLVAVEVRQEHVLAVRDAGKRDAQSPSGFDVRIMRHNLKQHGPHDLHQVKGRVHWAQKPLPRFLCNIDDPGARFSWKKCRRV